MRFRPLTFLFLVLLSGTVVLAQTNPTPRAIPFVEPFPSGTFSAYATGFQGWNGLSGAAITTQALAEASVPTGNATITAANPTTASVAGIYGSNGRVVLRSGSDATNGVNQLAMAINTTGQSNVRLSYSVTSVLTGPVTMGVVCQFRVGTAGGWTTIAPFTGSNPYVQTSGFTGLKTAVGMVLPVSCNNQPAVQVRWAVWRGTQAGNSAAFGIDDVAVTLLANDECTGTLVNVPLQDPGFCPANAIAGTTIGATDSGPDCVVSGTDVWYTITGDQGGGATVFLTPGTASGMGLQVFNTCGGTGFNCQTGTQHAFSVGFGPAPTLFKVFAQTPGTFTICAVRAPANNSVLFATTLPSQHPDSVTLIPGTTDFAINDGTIPCGSNPTAGDVWYALDGGAGMAVNVQLAPLTGQIMGVQVFSDNGSTPTYCGTGNFHSFQAIGTNYRMRVFSNVSGSFLIGAIRSPSNNESFNATPLPLQHPDSCTALTGNTAFATNSGTNCSFPTAKDVWYAVTGGPSNTARIQLNPVSAFNMGIQVFDGNGTETYCAVGTTHGFFVPQGSTYKVKVFAQEPGEFTICGVRPPANDEQFTAEPLTLHPPGTCTPLERSLDGAIALGTAPICAQPGSVDVWYSVTGGLGAGAHIELVPGTAGGMGVEVLDGFSGTATYCALGNSHNVQVPPFSTYLVRVFALIPGTYTICATAAPENNETFNALPLPLAQPGACTPLLVSTAFASPSATGCSPAGAADLWFAVTGGIGMAATIEITPLTASGIQVQVLDGPSGTQTYCAVGNQHTFQVPASSTYVVKVATVVSGTFTICAIAAPDNNESFTPVALTPVPPGTCSPLPASTVHATALDPNCVGTATRDLWYTVPSVPGQTVTIELVPGTATGLGVQVSACRSSRTSSVR